MISVTFVTDYITDEETQLYDVRCILDPRKGVVPFSRNLCFQIETPDWMRGFFFPSMGFDDEVKLVSCLAEMLLKLWFSIDGRYIYINLSKTLQIGDLNIFEKCMNDISITPEQFAKRYYDKEIREGTTLDPWVHFDSEMMAEIRRLETQQRERGTRGLQRWLKSGQV